MIVVVTRPAPLQYCQPHEYYAKELAGTSAKLTKERTHERMLKWEFVDLGEFRPRSFADKVTQEPDTEKLVVLPGFEVTQANKKPINSIITWVQCFSWYTAAMSSKFPECTPGFMSHMFPHTAVSSVLSCGEFLRESGQPLPGYPDVQEVRRAMPPPQHLYQGIFRTSCCHCRCCSDSEAVA